jgi:hypothetical protein
VENGADVPVCLTASARDRMLELRPDVIGLAKKICGYAP